LGCRPAISARVPQSVVCLIGERAKHNGVSSRPCPNGKLRHRKRSAWKQPRVWRYVQRLDTGRRPQRPPPPALGTRRLKQSMVALVCPRAVEGEGKKCRRGVLYRFCPREHGRGQIPGQWPLDRHYGVPASRRLSLQPDAHEYCSQQRRALPTCAAPALYFGSVKPKCQYLVLRLLRLRLSLRLPCRCSRRRLRPRGSGAVAS
jgi:hypothetical protein